MSMDKEELLKMLEGCNQLYKQRAEDVDARAAMTPLMILRAVIALVDIRESIDDLRSELTEMNALNSQLFREMLIQHGSATDPRDVRSAGIG